MISAGELASMRRDVLSAMPDTASIYRAAPTSTAGGWSQWPTNPAVHHTTKCRLAGLPAPIEETAAAEIASVTRWKLVVPAGTDVLPDDRVGVNGKLFEVQGGLATETWNITDAYYLTEILRT